MIQTNSKRNRAFPWGLKRILIQRLKEKHPGKKRSYYYIDRVLRGEVPDEDVLSMAKVVHQEYKERKERAAKALDELKDEM